MRQTRMPVLETLLVLSGCLLLVGGARFPRQLSIADKLRRLPNLNVCGLTEVPFIPKVIGGKPAEPGEFPWIAAIGYVSRGSRDVRWECGGSLISEQYVLTAAHCLHASVIGSSRKVTTIRLGELDLNPAVRDESQPQDVGVDKIVIHKQYNGRAKTNDIGLIKMKTKVTFSKFIKPICLPPQEFFVNEFEGFFPTVAGWGKTADEEPREDTRLLKAEVEVQEKEMCRRNVTTVPSLAAAIIDDRVVCASSPGKDSCQGDSGGPLMLPRKLKKSSKINFFLMGIVSYGHKCAKEGYPGVYTRVSRFMPWIIENLEL